MEMNTPDGYKLMNWETGYGDWIGRQAWETTRILPWLEETAIVLCDAVDGEAQRSRSRRGRCSSAR